MTSRQISQRSVAETDIIIDARTTDQFFADAARRARGIDAGDLTPQPARLSFASMEMLLDALTANRWRVLRALQGGGHTSIRALARLLGRDYRGVHGDVTRLIELGLVARDDSKRVFVPWRRITAEISVDEEAA
ncbi:MAG: hypothetical protein BroJett030_28160 [Alphaproteobacteria bacterium]|nr:MAG: hypothetical protein BroJett030_28160 [Alphaproteobacteria bacterium]